MIIQPIVNTAEICAQHGIKQVVICPGSRSAPITLAFSRHPDLKAFVIPDERSAGFIALGLAQSSNKPVVIVCTSGTAVANLYPAIIEAFYQQVPLLILTADRPSEWVDQQDGQTIRQQNIFQNHVLASYQFPMSFDHEDAIWESEKMISVAINKAFRQQGFMGPVHVNVPIREPFYPSSSEEYRYSKSIKIIKALQVERCLGINASRELIQKLKKYQRIAVVAGQGNISEHLRNALNVIQQKLNWLVFGDVTANVNVVKNPITKHDIILQSSSADELEAPDLVISFGQSVLSKSLKKYFRKNRPLEHWKIGAELETADTFKSVTATINLGTEYFFDLVLENIEELNQLQSSFAQSWKTKESKAENYISNFFAAESFSEVHATYQILARLPKNSQLHLANSMPVRYANIIGLPKDTDATVWSNRGASGIDGCISTVVGHALNTKILNIVISGDMAFFYDRNALWHNYLPDNLRIIILNNHGGGIFRLIDGPKHLKELEEFFETKQVLNAENTARDFGMRYMKVKNMESLPDLLNKFFDPKSGPSIMEIETDSATNQRVYEDFMNKGQYL